MRVLKSFVLAFSMYSKIPMPQINCDEEDTKYMMMFFPLVGTIIGAIVVGWYYLCVSCDIPVLPRALITILIPLVLTGGFHLDGFMDTSDARSSYQSRERKLEILKDSHIGAFAVIRVICYLMLYLAAVYMINSPSAYITLALGFTLSRIFSAYSVLTFKNARKEGMLFFAAKAAQRTANLIVVSVELLAVYGALLYFDFWAGVVVVVVTLLCYLYYRIMSYKTFGGITGDLAGWFVSFTECAIAVALAVYEVILAIC